MKKIDTVSKEKRTLDKKNISTKRKKISISNMKNRSIIIKNSTELINSYKTLVDNKEYTDFLNEYYQMGFLTKCSKHDLNFYFGEKEYIYPYPNSNQQFITYVRNALNYKNFGDLARLQAVLTKYVSFEFSFKVISYITKNQNKDLKDTDIIDYIQSTEFQYIYNNKIKQNKNACDPTLYMKQHTTKNIKKYVQKLLLNPNYKNNNYQDLKFLDFGCEYLEFSFEIKKVLNLSSDQFYGLHLEDVMIPPEQNINSKNFKTLNNVHKLPFEDNSFDFIFIHSFLQKILDLPSLLKELKRILKPNGFIYTIWIMTFDKNNNILCDIINTLKNVFINKKNINEYIKNPEFMRYFNYIEWDYILNKSNFKFIVTNYLKSTTKESITQNNGATYNVYQVEK